MGLDRIEHTIVPPADIMPGKSGPGTPEFDALVELFLKHNVYFVATMSVYGSRTLSAEPNVDTEWVDESQFFTPYIQELIAKRSGRRGNEDYAKIFKHKVPELKAFYEAGGGHLITVGSDRPTSGPRLAGFEVHREMQAMVFAGLPPVAALKAATINGARALRVGDRLGSIETGKLADLYVATGQSARGHQRRAKRSVGDEGRGGVRPQGSSGISGREDRAFGAGGSRCLGETELTALALDSSLN